MMEGLALLVVVGQARVQLQLCAEETRRTSRVLALAEDCTPRP